MRNKKLALQAWFTSKHFWTQAIFTAFAAFLVILGIVTIWVATLRIPDLQSFQNKVLSGSTKIMDKTGQVLLYNLNQDVKQQVVPFEHISQNAKNATIAIEDENFYEHKGIAFSSIIRAIIVDLKTLRFSQGGSTITQQVIKNSLLTSNKSIPRKIKEWVLALKLERVMTKDEILNLYLNSTSYGGTQYGIEVASRGFFGKSSSDLTIAESAYLAALPQAPSRYSPYGNRRDLLDSRKNTVLDKMLEKKFITEEEHKISKEEKVEFKPQQNQGIKAPHFVMFVRDYLSQKYGEDMIKNGGLTVITTLDYELQQKAEEITKKFALENTKNFNASNAALVAIDPTTGQILTMVGSRDYFDEKIEGNFNAAIAPNRQPGSTFKPFAYVTAFKKGYTPDTVLFDLPTQFSTACDATGKPLGNAKAEDCYMPQNYDDKFRGPMSLRNALSQSINIPSIKTLYLAGMRDTLQTAQDMGITSLTDPNRYGLTLVLGGGEVSLLEMTSAYGVFAQNGVRNPYTPIVRVTDRNGNVLEEFTPQPKEVLTKQPVLLLNNILYDNNARLALNGPGSATDFSNREVAVKTGTTNNYRDAWVVGYTPHIVVGAWAGNNNNTPMVRRTSGLILAPLWRAFMNEALKAVPEESFARPDPIDPNLKPILRGIWQGNQTYVVDRSSGNLATDFTPADMREERAMPNIHSILYWVDKNDPTGPAPARPDNDPQFKLWEPSVQAWAATNGGQYTNSQPAQIDNSNTPGTGPRISFNSPSDGTTYQRNATILSSVNYQSSFPISKVEFYVNDTLISTAANVPFSVSFQPRSVKNIKDRDNVLKAVAYDSQQNKGEVQIKFHVESNNDD